MPEPDGDAKNFYADVPPPSQGFFLKGSGSLDWGMSNRLARVFRPDTGRTVMLAIDHGYFQGPTTGLERVDLSILPLPFVMLVLLTGFEILVAVLQAFIFTILTAVYIAGAMHPEH